MDWKREAADMLRNYEAMRTSLEVLPKELERLETEATALHSSMGGGEPVVGGYGMADDRIISNIMRREGLKQNLELAKRHVDQVERALAILDEEERIALDMMISHRKKGNVERLCERWRVEKAQVYKRKDKALRTFTLALFGATESQI